MGGVPGRAGPGRTGPGEGGLTFLFLCVSRSIVNGTFSEVREAMFAHVPSLQLL